jgi:hypothetical protein
LSCTPSRNAPVSEVIKMDPASAVPTAAPRFVAVFCNPPTSGLTSSGMAETVTAPSCEVSAPMPRPASNSGTVTIRASAVGSMAARSTTTPPSTASNPRRTTRRGDACGKHRGIPTAAASRVIDNGRIRTPVSRAVRPSETDRNSGIVKNSPAYTR